MKKYGLIFLSILIIIALQVSRAYFEKEEKTIRQQIRQTVETQFPQQASRYQEKLGLKQVISHQAAEKNVVLIHGLDDPGKVWMTLVPVLESKPVNTWVMNYPNDQPISDSAGFFQEQLVKLAAKGVTDVSIVAHSMGGLVSREMLTNKKWQCKTFNCQSARPVINELIMVGTPNHGSELARFRELSEIREQISRIFSGETDWLEWILDGAGEAGVDLIPGSDFLKALNGRPLPKNTEHFVIAGTLGNDKTFKLNGDGLVSVDSAKLDNVEMTIVVGNHLSIIRNVSAKSKRTPPAIPLILEILFLK